MPESDSRGPGRYGHRLRDFPTRLSYESFHSLLPVRPCSALFRAAEGSAVVSATAHLGSRQVVDRIPGRGCFSLDSTVQSHSVHQSVREGVFNEIGGYHPMDRK